MIGLGKDKVRAVHIKVFRTQGFVTWNRIFRRLRVRNTGFGIRRLPTLRVHEKSPGATAGCAGRDTMASARKRSVMDRCRFGFVT